MAGNESSGEALGELRAGAFLVSEIRHGGGMTLPPHEHEHACLHVVLDGCYREASRGAVRDSLPGAALFKPVGLRHANEFPAGGARTLRIEIDTTVEFEWANALREPGHGAHPAIEVLGLRLRRELRRGDDTAVLGSEQLCRELLDAVLCLRTATTPTAMAERCALLLRERALVPGCRLGALADELRCDRSGLARAFRRRFHCSMGDYARALRVAQAIHLLETGRHSLVEVAQRAGFADQSHLTRVFTAAVGMPPGRWRRSGAPAAPRYRLP